ncbi:hypothetical protein [uncultured Eudoraea sp.]|uniref:hypothetical protein n=1 Tax=uncultured Eudoraea sp. TaxID=1035614 RepID=UPI00260B44E2|nr:hypothetical protein [uncultured Eudoraea sp.]
MREIKLISQILILVFILSSCSKDEENDETPAQESFSDWSPSFTVQMSDFVQTRSSSKGTQENRTIAVSSTSNSTESNEETEGIDENQDDDLFDDMNVIEITYTASNNLGSFSRTSYEITADNDMVLKVGNSEYEISNGYFYTWGGIGSANDDCITYEGYGTELMFYGPDGYLDNSGELQGEGLELYFDIFTPSPNDIEEGEFQLIWDNEFYDYESSTCIQPYTYSNKSSNYGDYQIFRENVEDNDGDGSIDGMIQIKEGQFDISKYGDKFIIKFVGVDSLNNQISFYYNGLIPNQSNFSGKGYQRKSRNN